jgi:hypothetical protein
MDQLQAWADACTNYGKPSKPDITKQPKLTNQASMSLRRLITTIFNDIQTIGLNEESTFALGWMCPIHKKKDPTEISNYHHPITLLNANYKLLTKVLAIQIVKKNSALVFNVTLLTNAYSPSVGLSENEWMQNHLCLQWFCDNFIPKSSASNTAPFSLCDS